MKGRKEWRLVFVKPDGGRVASGLVFETRAAAIAWGERPAFARAGWEPRVWSTNAARIAVSK